MEDEKTEIWKIPLCRIKGPQPLEGRCPKEEDEEEEEEQEEDAKTPDVMRMGVEREKETHTDM